LRVQQNSIDTIALLIEGGTFAHDSYTITTPAWELEANAITTAMAIDVSADGLTTGGLLNLVSGSSSTATRHLVGISNDHASAVNVTPLYISQVADGTGAHVNGIGTATDNVLLVSSNALTTGRLASFYSASSSTATRDLVEIHNDHSLSVNTTCLHLQNDGGPVALLISSGEIELNGGGGLDINDGGGIHMATGAFTISNGSMLMTAGTNIFMTGGGDLDMQGGGNIYLADDGNLLVNGGNATITGGDLTVTSGAVSLGSGNVTATGLFTINGGKLNFGEVSEFVVPRMDTPQRDANQSWTNGSIIYNTTTNKFEGREDGGWYWLTTQ
jgi:hypothetical protein